MAQLSDLFQMLGPQGDPDSLFGNPDIQQFIKNLADSHTVAGTPGFVVTDPTAPQPVPDQTNLSTPSGVPGISIDNGSNAVVPPLPAQRDLAGYAGQGQPYEAPKPQPEQPQVTTASVNPNTPQRNGSIVPDLTFGQRLRNAAMALQGQAPPDTEAQKLQANATYDALIKKGVDPDVAKAIVLNPAIMKQTLPILFGAGGKYGKTGAVFQDEAGKFYTVQFGEDGSKRIEPVQVPGAGGGPTALTPSRGVKLVDEGTGTGIVSGATGQKTGFIPKDIQGKAEASKFGQQRGALMAAKPQATSALGDAEAGLDRLAQTAREIHDSADVGRITGITGKFPSIPGGKAADLEAKLETLKSQVGFTVLQAMRNASKTGGALGNVSDYENQILQNNLAALQQSQSVDEFKTNLQKVIDYASGAKGRLRKAYVDTYGEEPQGAAPAPAGDEAAPGSGQWKTLGPGVRIREKP